MELLKDQGSFEEWKSNNIYHGDEAEMPKEFPCYVNKEVLNWNCEYVKAVYFYKDDFESMLKELN